MAEIDDFNTYLSERGYNIDADVRPALLAKAGDFLLKFQLRDSNTFSASDMVRYQTAKFMLANDFSSSSYSLKQSAAIKRQMDSVDTGLFSDSQYYDAPADLYPDITAMLSPLLVGAGTATYLVGKLTRGNHP